VRVFGGLRAWLPQPGSRQRQG